MESPVLEAARELFDARQFPGVAAVCAEALVEQPRDVSLRLLRVRALLALRRDATAQHEVSEVLRIEPGCGAAYRLLGELAARKDEIQSARVFLREALRLAPGDEETTVWLAIVDAMVPTVAVAGRVPAANGAVAHLSPLAPLEPRAPSPPAPPSSAAQPAVAAPVRSGPPPIPTAALARLRAARPTPPPAADEIPMTIAPAVRRTLPPPSRRPATLRGAEPVAVRAPSTTPSSFGDYLVDVGVLSELQLRATLAYKKSTGVRMGAAAVALGFATEQRIESASLVYHGRHRRPSVADVVGTARPERRGATAAPAGFLHRP